jgi:glycerol-3-phosphate O-acyltransferase
VRDAVRATPSFRARLERLAPEVSRPNPDLDREVDDDLAEMVAWHNRWCMNLLLRLARALNRSGYGDDIDYDAPQVARVRRIMENHPTVVLPSHKSNLDAGVMKLALRDNGLPPTYLFAGINMAFWPMGPVARRAGSIFIRRETRGDPVYRATLREYLGYLVETGQHIEWYIEGGRSRTGKLLPPRLGLLVYVIDAYVEGRTDDVFLVPVSIVYDQLSDVRDFAEEARGGVKRREGITWLIDFYRRQRRRYGRIYVRFGEPLSLRGQLGPPAASTAGTRSERDLELQKLAFEVSWRINQVTPVTGNALVTMTLLGANGIAMTLDQLRVSLRDLLGEVHRRQLPVAASVEALDEVDGVLAALRALEENHTVTSYAGGPRVVYSIGPDQQLAAAFYRNTAIHFFVDPAIADVAMAAACRAGEGRMEAFWTEALHLRDLFKFEFFFPEKDEFVTRLRADVATRAPDWEERLTVGSGDAPDVLAESYPSFASVVLRSFTEAYRVVAHELVRQVPPQSIDRSSFLDACQGRGQQYLLQRRIRTSESVSRPLFATGLELARNRGLLELDAGVAERRQQFRREVDDVLALIDAVDRVALRRYDRLLAEDEDQPAEVAIGAR